MFFIKKISLRVPANKSVIHVIGHRLKYRQLHTLIACVIFVKWLANFLQEMKNRTQRHQSAHRSYNYASVVCCYHTNRTHTFLKDML